MHQEPEKANRLCIGRFIPRRHFSEFLFRTSSAALQAPWRPLARLPDPVIPIRITPDAEVIVHIFLSKSNPEKMERGRPGSGLHSGRVRV
jgi:hypothetical protein